MLCPWLQQHTQAAQPPCLSPTLYFESLLRPMYLNLTPFLIYITHFMQSIWWSTETSHLMQVRDMCCLALHPNVNKQTTT
jgi:hypothetical protein